MWKKTTSCRIERGENIMCDFCSGKKFLVQSVADDLSVTLALFIDKNRGVLFYDTLKLYAEEGGIVGTIPIDFCPICGQKMSLIKDVDKK